MALNTRQSIFLYRPKSINHTHYVCFIVTAMINCAFTGDDCGGWLILFTPNFTAILGFAKNKKHFLSAHFPSSPLLQLTASEQGEKSPQFAKPNFFFPHTHFMHNGWP